MENEAKGEQEPLNALKSAVLEAFWADPKGVVRFFVFWLILLELFAIVGTILGVVQ